MLIFVVFAIAIVLKSTSAFSLSYPLLPSLSNGYLLVDIIKMVLESSNDTVPVLTPGLTFLVPEFFILIQMVQLVETFQTNFAEKKFSGPGGWQVLQGVPEKAIWNLQSGGCLRGFQTSPPNVCLLWPSSPPQSVCYCTCRGQQEGGRRWSGVKEGKIGAMVLIDSQGATRVKLPTLLCLTDEPISFYRWSLRATELIVKKILAGTPCLLGEDHLYKCQLLSFLIEFKFRSDEIAVGNRRSHLHRSHFHGIEPAGLRLWESSRTFFAFLRSSTIRVPAAGQSDTLETEFGTQRHQSERGWSHGRILRRWAVLVERRVASLVDSVPNNNKM